MVSPLKLNAVDHDLPSHEKALTLNPSPEGEGLAEAWCLTPLRPREKGPGAYPQTGAYTDAPLQNPVWGRGPLLRVGISVFRTGQAQSLRHTGLL